MANIKSMTGYGKGVRVCGNRRITVEIRALNGKTMDLSVKIPSLYRVKEFDIRSMVTKTVIRGKTDVFISYETIEAKAANPIDSGVFADYFRQVEAVSEQLGLNARTGHVIATILRMPEVMKSTSESLAPGEEDALLEAAGEALEHLDHFRKHEGEILMADIMGRIDKIEQLSQEAAVYESERVDAVKRRISDNINAIGVVIDPVRLEQELIFYLEKLDITEEKVRLKKHIDYFRDVVNNEEAPGRKLGFVCQELGREINTTGSKANHAEMQRLVVNMKDELEKIKEQSLNIL